MSVTKPRLIFFAFAALGAILIYSWHGMTHTRTLRVGYPLFVFRQDQTILDPRNTELVYQYYLLENLAVGLVRDSSQSPSGYGPGIAESWERLSPTRWTFRLRPELAWSDGTPIEPALIAAHIVSLSRENHRHIVYLKKLLTARIENRDLILEFSSPTNDGLIHELSLADSALLHPDNLTKNWSVTSGPFSVESYAPGKSLLLRSNPHYPVQSGYPERVELVGFTLDTIGNFFGSVDIDLLKIPLPSFRGSNPKLLAKAPQVLRGYPTWIYQLYFNPQNSLWRDVEARRAFSLITEQALKSFSYADLVRERQLIPKGYSGHLEDGGGPNGSLSGLLDGKRLKIYLLPSFADGPQIGAALKAGFSTAGVTLEVGYAKDLAAMEPDSDLQMTLFAGNQRDAMGSWQFMFSPDQGHLRYFRPKVEPFFDLIMASDDKEAREANVRVLHRHVLKEVYAVPLFIETDIIAASNRVDLSRLNPFDMRLRFYEVQWK